MIVKSPSRLNERCKKAPLVRVNDPQYSNNIALPLSMPTSDTRRLTELAIYLLRLIYRPGFAYKKASITLMGISQDNVFQGNLFEQSQDTTSIRLMETFDQINKKFGRGTLKIASETLGNAWQMKTRNRSLRFTTCWTELPEAIAKKI